MTLREEIQAKIDDIKKRAADDVAALEVHLAAGGSHLDQELHQVEAWFGGLINDIRAKLGYGPPQPPQ